ncbi:MAG: hypothetical protein KGQ95_00840 [Acidobacteria bacterium]|nr:hypothetical protein [Acidobacteriota bacterium]
MRPSWHIGAAAAIAASAVLIAGCGEGGGPTSAAPADPPAAGATVREAAAYPAVTCPNADYVAANLLLRNTTDIELKINSSNANGGDICRWFSGGENPSSYNGTTIRPGATLDMALFVRGESSFWKMSMLPIGWSSSPVVKPAVIQWKRSGEARSVLFQDGSAWVESFLLGPMTDKSGGLRNVVVNGGSGDTMTIAYSTK